MCPVAHSAPQAWRKAAEALIQLRALILTLTMPLTPAPILVVTRGKAQGVLKQFLIPALTFTLILNLTQTLILTHYFNPDTTQACRDPQLFRIILTVTQTKDAEILNYFG